MKALLKRVLRPYIRPLREFRAFRQRRAPEPVSIPVAGGRIDAVAVQADGVVSVMGWAPDLRAFEQALALRLGNEARPPSHAFRVPRPDVEPASRSAAFLGAVAEWALEPHETARPAMLIVEGREALPLRIPVLAATPYGPLHTATEIFGRDGIYGSGAPVHVVSDEVVTLARRLPQPILDFGCGGGALVRALRREGIEIHGLELDDERIRQHLLDEVKPFVTLYSGALPSPFADKQFASVVSSEVLEHIPGPHAALAEMARLARHTLLITVPDISSIPRGHAHAVVPWHLLESTHVNFFTQHSLARALAPHAASVEFARIGAVQCDRMLYYSSLAATATLPGTRRP